MRIAVLIYGRLNKCVENYENILKSLNINNNIIDFFCSSDNSNESSLNDFINLYKPILYDNSSKSNIYDIQKYNLGKNIYEHEIMFSKMVCHFANKNKVFSLLKTHINKTNIFYDVVVSLRIDVAFENNFVFDNLKNNTIYIPNHSDHTAINDQIAYGKIDVMEKYNSINIINLLENYDYSRPGPEYFNQLNIQINNLLIERVDLRYHITR